MRRTGLGSGDTIVAAVSGGPDSMTLLHALCHVRARGGPAVHVAHFDHELRPESGAVAAGVVAAAGACGVPV
ncbi:MAG: tRNA(Ile)-lysidine synthetase, partial [Actinobacteria bacterium]|nr:tRNA(Ile)-lysidine synthetase [Actinomycetota bacterium]